MIMEQINWIERKFNFGYAPGYLPLFIERLNSSVPRIKQLTLGLTAEELRFKPNNKWCIKQHIGHLTDLEELHEGRLQDFLNKLPALRAADMSNKKTEDTDHINTSLKILISDFQSARKNFIDKVRTFTPEQMLFKSFHPRLKQDITVVDLLFFLSEHDNAHLTHISSIIDKK